MMMMVDSWSMISFITQNGELSKMDKKAENLKKLSRTNIIMNFIKKNSGSWDHQTWLEFCDYLTEKGYTPIDLDKVGELLETKKAAYLASK